LIVKILKSNCIKLLNNVLNLWAVLEVNNRIYT